MIDGEIYNQQMALKKSTIVLLYNVALQKKLCDFQFAHIWGDVGPPRVHQRTRQKKKSKNLMDFSTGFHKIP